MPADDLLASPYRIMRRVEAPADSPWPGLLATAPGQGSVLLVDAALLPEDWAGWIAEPSGHVLAPLDVVRRADGHDVSLPVCAERVTAFFERRVATPLSEGERLTLAVSVARGIQELAAAGRLDCTGTWWLTDAGRPVFIAHADGEGATVATSAILDELARDARPRMAEVLDGVCTALGEPATLSRRMPRLEEELFVLTNPEPLATAVLAPRRAREFDTAAGEHGAVGARTRGGFVDTVSRHVDADLADIVSRITTDIWRRLHRPAATRPRRRILVPLGVGAVVLGVGLVWPTGGAGGPAVAQTPVPSDLVTQGPAPSNAGSVVASGDADLAALASRLLTERSACAGDAGCLALVVEDPSSALPPGAAELPVDQRTITLLDDFGGAAVLRVQAIAPQSGTQLVVIVRSDERWLLRDVHDITEQP